MKTRRTARTIVVWVGLLLLIASWFYTYFDSECYRIGSPSPPLVCDSPTLMLMAGFNHKALSVVKRAGCVRLKMQPKYNCT
jgi:hypothetical protein